MDCNMPGFPALHCLRVCSDSCPCDLTPCWRAYLASGLEPRWPGQPGRPGGWARAGFQLIDFNTTVPAACSPPTTTRARLCSPPHRGTFQPVSGLWLSCPPTTCSRAELLKLSKWMQTPCRFWFCRPRSWVSACLPALQQWPPTLLFRGAHSGVDDSPRARMPPPLTSLPLCPRPLPTIHRQLSLCLWRGVVTRTAWRSPTFVVHTYFSFFFKHTYFPSHTENRNWATDGSRIVTQPLQKLPGNNALCSHHGGELWLGVSRHL